MRILSIDWDWFINATRETRTIQFPDGGEFSLNVESHIWMTHYCNSNLKHIGVYQQSLCSVYNLLCKQNDIPVMIANGHKHCYDFVCDLIPDTSAKIELINFDFHHDVYNNNVKLDNGNWLRYLMERYKNIDIKWIRRPTSDLSHMSYKLKTILETEVQGNFDAIFICRSGLWSPPHLDKHFSKLIKPCLAHSNVLTQQGIFIPRYNEDFQTGILQLSEVMCKMH